MFCLIGPNASGRERSILFQTLAKAAGRTLFLWTEAPSHLRQGFAATMFTLAGVIPQIMSFWQQVLAGIPFNPQNPNPNFVGTSLSQGLGVPDPALFAPNYQTPRSVEINFGIQV
jgi:hypothetical protein